MIRPETSIKTLAHNAYNAMNLAHMAKRDDTDDQESCAAAYGGTTKLLEDTIRHYASTATIETFPMWGDA